MSGDRQERGGGPSAHAVTPTSCARAKRNAGSGVRFHVIAIDPAATLHTNHCECASAGSKLIMRKPQPAWQSLRAAKSERSGVASSRKSIHATKPTISPCGPSASIALRPVARDPRGFRSGVCPTGPWRIHFRAAPAQPGLAPQPRWHGLTTSRHSAPLRLMHRRSAHHRCCRALPTMRAAVLRPSNATRRSLQCSPRCGCAASSVVPRRGARRAIELMQIPPSRCLNRRTRPRGAQFLRARETRRAKRCCTVGMRRWCARSRRA